MDRITTRVGVTRKDGPSFDVAIAYEDGSQENHTSPGLPSDADTYVLGFRGGTLTLHTGKLPDGETFTEQGIHIDGNVQITGTTTIQVQAGDRAIDLPWPGEESLLCTWPNGAQFRIHGGADQSR
jgi:hypothetical protein